MRLALLADIHGNLEALEAVLADAARQATDVVVNLGDHVSGPLWPGETADFLTARSDWIQIAGNQERQLLAYEPGSASASDRFARERLTAAHLDWLRGLPPSATVGDVLLCHGSPRSDLEYLLETVEPGTFRPAREGEIAERVGGTTAPVVACGHTHLPRIVRLGDGRLVVNPGSVGLPAYDDAAPYPHQVENGSPDARYAVLERGPSGWDARLCSVPYDHERAARQAERNARRDWAHALRTGRVASREAP